MGAGRDTYLALSLNSLPMGITASDIELIQLACHQKKDIKTVCELGSQNLYRPGDDQVKPPFAKFFYESLGMEYTAIDMACDNGAMPWDLSQSIRKFTGITFDLITDFGTSEHVVANMPMVKHTFHDGHINSVYPTSQPTPEQIKCGYYECWRNKHNLLALNGIMISVNPKTGNWPEHGYTYINTDFYKMLAGLMGYEVYWLNENEAMGNPNAVNIECVLRKVIDNEFMSFEDFQTCDQFPA